MRNIGAQKLRGFQDDVYELLIRKYDGLSPEACCKLSAQLILLLANELGDIERLQAVLARADLAAGAVEGKVDASQPEVSD
jgi:hypothetical protein